MIGQDKRSLGVFLGFSAWGILFLLSRFLNPSLPTRLILLAAQQAMFICIGFYCVRSEILINPGRKELLKGIFWGIALYAVNAVLGSLSLQVGTLLLGAETVSSLLKTERSAIEPFLAGGNTFHALVMSFALIVGAPLSEELFFRGLILDSLRERAGTAAAVFLAALLFAALHFYFIQFVPVLGAGIVLGIMFIRTQNLLIPIVAHAVTNVLALAAWFLL